MSIMKNKGVANTRQDCWFLEMTSGSGNEYVVAIVINTEWEVEIACREESESMKKRRELKGNGKE